MTRTTTEQQGVVVSAQVSAETRRELERLAAEGDRTLSAQVRRLLQQQLDHEVDDGEGGA